jgi:hypothetical protein
MSVTVPQNARVVIVGGGVSGCSVAYHLAKLGWTDIVLLERKQLTCGTTWHAAGLIGQLRASLNMTRLAKYSADLYVKLEEETGVATGMRQCGSITVALTEARKEEIYRQALPLHACEHFYIVTEPIDGLSQLPVLRVPDECAYYKEDAGKMMLGAFEPKAKPWGMDGIPDSFEFDQLPEDFDHFEPILEQACNRMPMLAEAGIHTFFNGPGELHARRRLLSRLCAGDGQCLGRRRLQLHRHQSAGGAGMRWRNGWRTASRRSICGTSTSPHASRSRAIGATLSSRVTETLGLLYADHFPYRQMATARGVRRSPSISSF